MLRVYIHPTSYNCTRESLLRNIWCLKTRVGLLHGVWVMFYFKRSRYLALLLRLDAHPLTRSLYCMLHKSSVEFFQCLLRSFRSFDSSCRRQFINLSLRLFSSYSIPIALSHHPPVNPSSKISIAPSLNVSFGCSYPLCLYGS